MLPRLTGPQSHRRQLSEFRGGEFMEPPERPSRLRNTVGSQDVSLWKLGHDLVSESKQSIFQGDRLPKPPGPRRL